MDRLDGSSVVPDESHELVDLGLGDQNFLFHYNPVDPFRARGRRERTVIGEMMKIVRDQRRKIQLARRSRFTCVHGQSRPEGRHHRVPSAQIGEERHDNDVAGLIAMHKMEFKGGGPSLNMVFARFVKVKLHQSIGPSIHM